MGMGMPVTSCYVILTAVGVSSLVAVGVEPINAHMMLFWSTILGGITPPVCVAAYVAAQVAQADPMKTGFSALKMGMTFYIIPMLFLTSNFLTGTIWEIVCIFFIMAWGFYFMVLGIEGYLYTKLGFVGRIICLVIFFFTCFGVSNFVAMTVRIGLITAATLLGIFIIIFQKKKYKYDWKCLQ